MSHVNRLPRVLLSLKGRFLVCLAWLTLILGTSRWSAAEEFLVSSFSDRTQWRLSSDGGGGPRLGKSTVAVVEAPVSPGVSRALKLDYDLSQCDYLCLRAIFDRQLEQEHPGSVGHPILGRPESLFFWLYGNGQKHKLTTMLVDAAGVNYLVPLGTIDGDGWRKVDVPLAESSWRLTGTFPKEPRTVRWPIMFREVRMERGDPKAATGSLVFSELRAVGPVSPLDRLEIRVACDAPAHMFYLPEPVVLTVRLENQTDASLDGHLETVVEDWLGHTETFQHGPLLLKPKEVATRTAEVPIQALGAYRVWVQFRGADRLRASVWINVGVSRKLAEPPALDPDSPFGLLFCETRLADNVFRDQLSLMSRLGSEAGARWNCLALECGSPEVMPAEGRFAWQWPQTAVSQKGRAIEFWRGQHLSVPYSSSLDRPRQTGEMTIRCTLRLDKTDNPGPWQTIVAEGGAGGLYNFFWSPERRQLFLAFGNGQGQFADVACTKTDWKTGAWYQVVVAHRHSDKSTQWWVNGKPAGEGKTPFDGFEVTARLPLILGGELSFSLDDLAIYDQTATPDAVETIKPVAHWTFDEPQADRFADDSGNGNDILVQRCRVEESAHQMREAGMSLFGLLLTRPSWMAVDPQGSLPKLAAWSAMLDSIVRHFSQQGVHAWQVWNEPNCGFWQPKPNAEDYYQTLAASYQAIKKADPRATVLGCATTGPSTPHSDVALDFIEEVLKRGGINVMDAIAIHPYQPSRPENPDFLADLDRVGDLTARYGRRLPIWITEIGWGSGTVAGWSEKEVAKVIVRAYLLSFAHGVTKVFWYDFRNDGIDPYYHEHNWGLVRNDYTPKACYFSFRTMATELAGLKFVRELKVRDDVSVLLFSNGQRNAAVAWAHRGSVPVAFRLGGLSAIEAVDLMGHEQPLPVREGAMIATLTDAPLFLRNVPGSLDVVLPVESAPRVIKLLAGQPGRFEVTLRNPFDGPVELSAAGHKVALRAGGKQTVAISVPADEAAARQPPVWRNGDGTVAIAAPVEMVLLAGQREPLLTHPEEVHRPTEVAYSSALNVSDEVTIAFSLHVAGPPRGWQTPIGKWQGTNRNYLVALHPQTGEMYFSASFEKVGGFLDIASGVKLCDGAWHRVVVTYSMHDARVGFYVDGKPTATKPNSTYYVSGHRIAAETLDGGPLKPNDATVVLGDGFPSSQDPQGPPSSAVRDIRVWNRALSGDEILGLK